MKRSGMAMAAVAVAGVLGASGCQFGGLNSYPLPLTEGGGDGSYRVTVEMKNAVNLVPNSEVKVGDLTVGSVRKIDVQNWHAKLTVGLNKDVKLPANAVARIGQKSLLGAEYLELAPPTGAPPRGQLRDGGVIPMSSTGRFPETEEVLSALSLMLNGGGFDKIHTITRELNRTLGGREMHVRALLSNLNKFTGSLDAQRHNLVRMLDNFDRLGGTLNEQNQTVAKAVETIPGGLKTINEERDELVRAMSAVSDVREVTTRVMQGSGGQGLIKNLRQLQPSLRELADAGKDLPESVGGLTPLFPLKTVTDIFKGDSINFFITLDLTSSTLLHNFTSGTPIESLLGKGPLAPPLKGPGIQGKDPLRAPLEPPDPSEKPDPSQQPAPGQGGDKPAPAPGDGQGEGVGGLIDNLFGGGR